MYNRIDRRDVRNKIETIQLLFKRSYLDDRVNPSFEGTVSEKKTLCKKFYPNVTQRKVKKKQTRKNSLSYAIKNKDAPFRILDPDLVRFEHRYRHVLRNEPGFGFFRSFCTRNLCR
jgi:hypothetical protein